MQRRQFLAATAALGLAGPALAGDKAARDVQHARDYTTRRRFMATRFGKTAYVERGDGPAALFLHGFPLSSFQWRDAIALLSPHRRCIAPDFMGLGLTEVARGQGVAPADQVEMLTVLLERLGVDRFDLIANDSGGAVAQLLALRHPGRVRTLLLTNCDVEPDSPPPALLPVIEMAREGTYPDTWLVPWLADKALCRSAEGLGGLCYSDPAQPTDAAIEQYLGPLVASPERKALTNAYTLGLDPNPLAGIEKDLRKLQVPARIVWGMSDDIFSKDSPGYLDRVLPQSRGVRRLEKAKLFFPEEYPEVIAEEALKLWA
ncbi:alpha/beta hydrolase [Caulobacter segnis]|uniref:alpha/beta fold hydrolase n=1 Tax=Caulobacter segnis TaxID=88688 RepID=UPI0024102BCA|nr:alpha/beta hydrolase [Caulobacter segnis]MDG2521460.1 alpha/beta hydrolase [Caulobacter segnis]